MSAVDDDDIAEAMRLLRLCHDAASKSAYFEPAEVLAALQVVYIHDLNRNLDHIETHLSIIAHPNTNE